MKTIKDLEKEFDEKFIHYYRREIPMLNASPPKEVKGFIRSAIKQAFEETRVKVRVKKDFRGTFPGTEENIGFNQALTEVKKKQEEFLAPQ